MTSQRDDDVYPLLEKEGGGDEEEEEEEDETEMEDGMEGKSRMTRFDTTKAGSLSEDGYRILNIKKEIPSPPASGTFSNVSSPETGLDETTALMATGSGPCTIDTSILNNINLNNSIIINNNNNGGGDGGAYLKGNSSIRCDQRREECSSELKFAKALLEYSPSRNMCVSSTELDRSSVLRLAQAYVTLQQGLRSWTGGVNPPESWPDFVDSGEVTLKSQQAMGCFILIITGHGTIVYVSDAIEGLLGHDQINLVGRSVQALFHPEELSVLATQFSLFAGTGQLPNSRSFYTRMLNMKRSGPTRQRYELVHVIGDLQDVVLSASSDRTMGQKETWLMCACKMMSPVLEEEGSSTLCKEWITHNELDGKIMYTDSRSCQVTGYLPNEVSGMSPYCFIHSDDQEHVAFSHNQALISANGATSTYRMYTSSHDLIYVQTSMQLSRDKLTNKPKALFCIHRVLDEKEGRDQINHCHHEVMRSKVNPSRKFTMLDIERTVKTLEQGGVASRSIPSKGGMMNSRLTDSCTSDGTDLLRRRLSHYLIIPTPSLQSPSCVMPPTTRGRGRGGGYRGRNSPYHRQNQHHPHLNNQQQQQQQQHHQQQQSTTLLHRQNSFSPVSPISGQGNAYTSMKEVWNHPHAHLQQQQHNQHQQSKMYRRQNSNPSGQHLPHQQHPLQQQQQQQQLHQQHSHQQHQQMMMSPPAGRSPYPHQMSVPSPAICSSPISAGGSTPRASSPLSFVDLLCDDTGPHSVPTPESHHSFHSDISLKKPLMPRGGRGRGRARGRPRGSGRGARGGGRGVGRPRGSRGGRGRGRGRGQSQSQTVAQLTQMREMSSAMKRSMSLDCTGQYSMPSGNNGQSSMLGGGHSGMLPRQMEAGFGENSLHSSIPAVVENESNDSFQRMLLSDDNSISMLDSYSSDSFDFLDVPSASMKNYDMRRVPSLELLSPSQSSVGQDCGGIAENTAYKGMMMPGANLPSQRGSHHKQQRSRHTSQDFYPAGMFQRSDSQKSTTNLCLDGNDIPLGPNIGILSKQLENNPVKAKGSLQHSASFPAPSCNNGKNNDGNSSNNSSNNNNNNKSQTDETDVEHSILGNLLKGSGGSLSAGSKSPIHAGFGRGELSPSQQMTAGQMGNSVMGNPLVPIPMSERGGVGGKMAVDIASPFSPNGSVGNTALKGPTSAGLIGVRGINPPAAMMDKQARSNPLSEMQMFSDQLQQKHKSLEQSFVSQEHLLSHLESNMQQAVHNNDPESLYARLNARLDVIKANKAKQEKELRMIKAKLESQVKQSKAVPQPQGDISPQVQSVFQSGGYPTGLTHQLLSTSSTTQDSESQQQQQLPQQQSQLQQSQLQQSQVQQEQLSKQPQQKQPQQQLQKQQQGQLPQFQQQPPPPVNNNANNMADLQTQQSQQQQQQQQRHCLNSPAPLNPRRMAIVPPIQRQLEVDTTSTNSIIPQSGSIDLKAVQSQDSLTDCVVSKSDADIISPSCGGSDILESNQQIKKMQQPSQHQKSLSANNSTSPAKSSTSLTSGKPSHPQQLGSQASSYSLHHHHHHHHYHHHHPVPVLTCQQQPESLPSSTPSGRQPPPPQQQQKQGRDFPTTKKLSIPSPPYCPFDSFTPSSSSVSSTSSTTLSSSSSSTSSNLTQSALSISTSSLRTSLTSPIACDTSPISVDKSPSCASDASSGYHSLSLSAESTGATVMVGGQLSSMPGCQSKKVLNSPELLTSSGHVYPPPSN